MLRLAATAALLFVIVGVPVFGQASAKDDRLAKGREFLGLAPAADPAAAERGHKIFGQNCAFCHGQNATGAEGPDLVRSSVVLHDEHGELIGEVVSKGRPDRGMPAFASFTPTQIGDIAAFLHSRVEAAANRWGYKVQNVVTGKPELGKAFFDQHCASCHSPQGDLRHIATQFQPADLQAEFLYPASAKAVRHAAIHVKANGSTVHGVLKNLDDFDVSIWDDSGQFRGWPREAVDVQVEDPLTGHRKLLDVYSNADMHNVLAYLETLK